MYYKNVCWARGLKRHSLSRQASTHTLREKPLVVQTIGTFLWLNHSHFTSRQFLPPNFRPAAHFLRQMEFHIQILPFLATISKSASRGRFRYCQFAKNRILAAIPVSKTNPSLPNSHLIHIC